jgi:hypothetical protein
VTWSRDAASKSWECSSGGIRAPTIGEAIVLFAVENSAPRSYQDAPGIPPSCIRPVDRRDPAKSSLHFPLPRRDPSYGRLGFGLDWLEAVPRQQFRLG